MNYIFGILQFCIHLASALVAGDIEIPAAKIKQEVQAICEEITERLYLLKLDRDCRILLVRWTMLGVDAQLIGIPEGFADFFLDPDFAVRIYFAGQTRVLFEIFEDSQHIYESLELLFLEKMSGSKAVTLGESISSLAVLVQSAMTLPEFEGPVLAHLCLLAVRQPNLFPVIQRIYDQMETHLGYFHSIIQQEESASFLGDLFGYVFAVWLSKEQSLGSFPLALLRIRNNTPGGRWVTLTSVKEFIGEYEAPIVSTCLLLLAKKRKMALTSLSRVCEVSGKALHNLLDLYFSRIVACLFVLNFEDKAAQEAIDLNPELEGEEREEEEWVKQGTSAMAFLQTNLESKYSKLQICLQCSNSKICIIGTRTCLKNGWTLC